MLTIEVAEGRFTLHFLQPRSKQPEGVELLLEVFDFVFERDHEACLHMDRCRGKRRLVAEPNRDDTGRTRRAPTQLARVGVPRCLSG